jgi:hypothetical protein
MLRSVAAELEQFEREFRPTLEAPLHLESQHRDTISASTLPDSLS